jgi:phosphatidylglycerophosphate synthase
MVGVVTKFIYRNLANATSLLGVLPLVILYFDDGYLYVIPLIIYNNFVDDLDGVLAAKLNIRSRFGADLDNVCDAVAHISLALAVGAHFGGFVMVASAIAAGSILIRIVSRLNPKSVGGIGSQTNELMRHMLFALLLSGLFNISPEYILVAVFLMHSVSMVLPFSMPHFIIDRANSPTLLGLVNITLVVAWLVPITTPIISAAFVAAYVNSFIVGSVGWRNKLAVDTLPQKIIPTNVSTSEIR